MYLFLNVSFHSLTKIESNSSQIRFFFFHLPTSQTYWPREMTQSDADVQKPDESLLPPQDSLYSVILLQSEPWT